MNKTDELAILKIAYTACGGDRAAAVFTAAANAAYDAYIKIIVRRHCVSCTICNP